MQKTREQIMNEIRQTLTLSIAFDYPLDITGHSMNGTELKAHNEYIEKIGAENVVGGYVQIEVANNNTDEDYHWEETELSTFNDYTAMPSIEQFDVMTEEDNILKQAS